MNKEVESAWAAVTADITKLETEINKTSKDGKEVPKAVLESLDELKKRAGKLEKKLRNKL